MPSINVIVYPAEDCCNDSHHELLPLLANMGCYVDIISYAPERQEENARKAVWHIADSGKSWPEIANYVCGKSPCDYLLFVSAGALIDEDCVACLAESLRDENCCGANPVFLKHGRRQISHLGIVADSRQYLHFLYPGISADSALAGRERCFQLAHPAVFMLRKDSFMQAGGFLAEKGLLFFMDFCLRLGKSGKMFRTVAGARAVYENRLETLRFFGFWNSVAMRGRLPARVIRPDYLEHVKHDGFEYGISQWLCEGPLDADVAAAGDAWDKWQKGGNPADLVEWLSLLEQPTLAQALDICREFPVWLPAQFRYYEARGELLSQYSENNGLFRLGEQLRLWLKRAKSFRYGELRKRMRMLRDAGIYNVSLDRCASQYDMWLELRTHGPAVAPGNAWPRIALAMPVYNPDLNFLRQALDSVLAQSYPNWELCVADDASTDPETRQALEAWVEKTDRIKVVYRERNGHISRATNSALELVAAPWTGFMDQDDMLAENALLRIAQCAFENSEARFIFTDEDHIDSANIRRSPIFKTGFDSDLFFSGHLSAYATDMLKSVGGLNTGVEGSQDMDLCFRILEHCHAGQIIHIPEILYHWRVYEGSTAGSIGSKPYALIAAHKAVSSAAMARKWQGEAALAENSNYFIFRHCGKRDASLEMVVFTHGETPDCGFAQQARELAAYFDVRESYARSSGNIWKALRNLAENEINGDIILILDDRLEPLPGCRLEQLPMNAMRPEIAAAGSMLWHNGRLWHGGLYPDASGLPFRLLYGARKPDLRNYCWGNFLLNRQTLGISWHCMALKREVLLECPFDEKGGMLAEADFALRQLQKNRKVMITPWSQWRWRMPPPAMTDTEEMKERFEGMWGESVRNNGLRNPNLERAPDNDWKMSFATF